MLCGVCPQAKPLALEPTMKTNVLYAGLLVAFSLAFVSGCSDKPDNSKETQYQQLKDKFSQSVDELVTELKSEEFKKLSEQLSTSVDAINAAETAYLQAKKDNKPADEVANAIKTHSQAVLQAGKDAKAMMEKITPAENKVNQLAMVIMMNFKDDEAKAKELGKILDDRLMPHRDMLQPVVKASEVLMPVEKHVRANLMPRLQKGEKITQEHVTEAYLQASQAVLEAKAADSK